MIMGSLRTMCFYAGLICLSIQVILCAVSIKRGISLWHESVDCDDFQLISDIAWLYDWRNDIDHYKTACPELVTFLDRYVPMTWGRRAVTDLQIPASVEAVLGFNEPNRKDQANMTAAEAAGLWNTIEQAAGDRILVSPAAAPCNDANCLGTDFEWFEEFFQLCPDCKVDAIAVHDYTCNVDFTMGHMKQLFKKYNKPIWLTEFACPQTFDVNVQLEFMKAILPRLEKSSFVDRYSWFTARRMVDKYVKTSANLFEIGSSNLTALGTYYLSYEYQP